LKKGSTVIAAPEAVAKSVPGATILRNGETKSFGAWTIEAIPMYNLTRGPFAGQQPSNPRLSTRITNSKEAASKSACATGTHAKLSPRLTGQNISKKS